MNQQYIDSAFTPHINGPMSDEDYDYLLWSMECDGIPAELLDPIREYFRQPVPTLPKLMAWVGQKFVEEHYHHDH